MEESKNKKHDYKDMQHSRRYACSCKRRSLVRRSLWRQGGNWRRIVAEMAAERKAEKCRICRQTVFSSQLP